MKNLEPLHIIVDVVSKVALVVVSMLIVLQLQQMTLRPLKRSGSNKKLKGWGEY